MSNSGGGGLLVVCVFRFLRLESYSETRTTDATRGLWAMNDIKTLMQMRSLRDKLYYRTA